MSLSRNVSISFERDPRNKRLGGLQAPRGRGLNRIEHRFCLGEIQPAV